MGIRFTTLLGNGVVLGGISTALLIGAAGAAADPTTELGRSDPPASESSQPSHDAPGTASSSRPSSMSSSKPSSKPWSMSSSKPSSKMTGTDTDTVRGTARSGRAISRPDGQNKPGDESASRADGRPDTSIDSASDTDTAVADGEDPADNPEASPGTVGEPESSGDTVAEPRPAANDEPVEGDPEADDAGLLVETDRRTAQPDLSARTDSNAPGHLGANTGDPVARTPPTATAPPMGTAPHADTASGNADDADNPSPHADSSDFQLAAPEVGYPTTRDGSAGATAAPAGSPLVAARALTAAPDTPPGLLHLVGSAILNILGSVIRLIDGPPVLPPGSTVTVRTSTLTVPVDGGRQVEANWYFPDGDEPPSRFVYLQHGFMATGPMYSYTAARLAEETNSIVVTPTLSSNFLDPNAAWVGGYPMQRAVADLFAGDRAALTESASMAAGQSVTLPERVVLVGHSAGGTLVTAAAGYMTENGAIHHLAGVVLLDPVDPKGSVAVQEGLAKLVGVYDRSVLAISSERYWLSRNGDVADVMEEVRPGRFNGVKLVGGRHIDYQEGGNFLVQLGAYLVGGVSQPQNIAAARTISVGWVNDMFAGTTDGIYGSSQERITVDTADGTATVVAFPMAVTPTTPADALLSVIFDFVGANVFVYEPLTNPTAVTSSPIAA